MADPGVSTQNFLRLLLGGAQQGADVFQQRQTMKQQQAPDLMLALQQMMQRKQMADVEQAQREKALEYQHSQITADRMRQGGLDYQNALQQGIENRRADEALGLNRQKAQAMIEHYRALADKARNEPPSGSTAALSNMRLSIATLLKSEEDAAENYEWLDEGGYAKLPVPLRTSYSAHFAKDDAGQDIVRYRKLRPGAAAKVAGLKKALEMMGGIEPGALLGEASPNTFAVDEDEASVLAELEAMAEE